jgi:hypothetical protein
MEELKRYEVIFYNRFAQETQTFHVIAKNKFRAGRLFYLRYDRKSFFDCIEYIGEIKEDYFWTEEKIHEWRNRRNESSS